MLRSAVSRAEQLADEETDVVAGAVGATRSNELDSFIAPAGAGASSSARPGEERDREPMQQKQRDLQAM
jgi:hypothetical protein